jgi:carbon-monoxide dehydrogenase medium subunit
VLVDINRVSGLDRVETRDGWISIGATARARDLERNEAVAAASPLLVEALRWVGHVEIRNRTTLGGSLAHADPAAELPLVAVALGARVIVRGPHGERTVPAEDLFAGYLTTSLAEDELLLRAEFPRLGPDTSWGFAEFSRRHGDFALASATVLLERRSGGACARAVIALGGVAPTPVRATAAEQALEGEALSPEVIRSAAATAAADLDPPDDVQASGRYRRRLAEVLVEQALTEAAQGGGEAGR